MAKTKTAHEAIQEIPHDEIKMTDGRYDTTNYILTYGDLVIGIKAAVPNEGTSQYVSWTVRSTAPSKVKRGADNIDCGYNILYRAISKIENYEEIFGNEKETDRIEKKKAMAMQKITSAGNFLKNLFIKLFCEDIPEGNYNKEEK